MLNKGIIIGRLVRDVELRRTQTDKSVCSITVAVDRDFKSEGQPTADFIDVICFGKTAEFVSKWFSKGSMIVIDGRIQTRNWEDKNGNKRISVEVVAERVNFGGSKKETTEEEDFTELEDDEVVPF